MAGRQWQRILFFYLLHYKKKWCYASDFQPRLHYKPRHLTNHLLQTHQASRATWAHRAIDMTECNRSRLATLKFRFAFILASTVVALWCWLRNNEWEASWDLVRCCVTYVTEQRCQIWVWLFVDLRFFADLRVACFLQISVLRIFFFF